MSEFAQLLEAGDVDALRKAWHRVAPNMPQPVTRGDAEIVMHMARTAAETVKLEARAYSHQWLIERGHPSQLPDSLRPKAERMHPVVVGAVGISVNFRSKLLQGAASSVQMAMSNAVEECYADGRKEPEFVARRMAEAKDREMKALFGGLGK